MAPTMSLPDWIMAEAPIIGAENGFNERADVIVAADGTDLNVFWNEVQDTIRIRNAQRNSIIDRLATRVTGAITSVNVPSEVNFEEASEYGQPVGIRGTFARMWRGYDFKFYDLAIRYTWMFLAEADRQQLEMNHNLALDADNKLLFNKVMRTLFNPLNVTGVGDKNEPTTVYKFYNGDGEVPPPYATYTHAGTHNHYLTSGAATVTSGDLDEMAEELAHHGYTLGNNYQLVLMVNKQEANVIRGFKTATGASFDFVPNPSLYGGKVWVPNDGRYVGGPTGTVQGEIGTYGPWHVVDEPYIPAGYMVGLASGGAENLQNPIGIREHANPAYRGLKIIPGQRSDYPLVDSFYRRGFGTGIRQRGGGVVMQVTANASYTIPSVYA
ncbi:MAG: hypothetical protein LC687_05005 [Actinobacteria bacterium]|nr:hypothetical protein [Actinomycetota bacterium]MCA1807193.1 hypothetical protein [Actinomycetota bacterium]